MKKMILDLWNGELCPVSRSGLNNSNINKLEAQLARQREELKKSLEKERLRAFEQYLSCEREYCSELMDQAFVDGYSMGTRITAEAMLGAEETSK